MLDATNNMDEDVKVLEVVSDAEEVAEAMESEHEEGEISEDDDDDEVGLPGQQHFPHHYPSDYHKERQPGKNASATSAVVIYDDRGRTAIFTSPRKNLRASGSYKRRADSGRRWKQEEMEKRRHKDDEARKHQKDNGMGRKWQILDNEGGASGASTKRTKYMRQGLRRLGSSAGWESDKVPGAKNKRSLDQPRHLVAHRSHTSSSDSDSSYCSCSSYSSSSHSGSDSPVQRRGRGKENKRSGTASRARSRSPEQGFSSTKKKLAYKKSSEKWPSKKSPPWAPPVTQDKESTRASSPAEAASKISKSWGNGRKSPRPYMRHTLPTSSSRKTEVKASHHKTNKSKAKENVVKISDDESDEKCDKSPRAKCDTSPKGNGGEVPLISSQKQLPRGSFGEMLLKKTLKGKLKVCPLANKSVEKGETSGEAGGSKKEEISEISEVLQQDCDTLDQEDEDELQLRLIALQSSLKVLSDVRREGCQSINTGNMVVDLSLSLPQDSIDQPLEKEEEGKEAASSDLPDQRNSENIGDFQDQLPDHHILLQSDAESSTPLKNNQSFDTRLEESTPKEDEVDLILDDLSQSSTRSQPGSSITGLELELDAISTNKSYLDDGEDSTRQLATNIEEQLQREIKDLADSNQDPVDMDICDSSPSEEDESFFDEDILKDTGEDISLDKVSSPDPSSAPNIGSQAKDYPVPVLDPGGQESFHHNSSNSTKSSSNNNSNSNFQIPVEWAYMMPPPPPPDQPPNDISNINNWCYDQNMYLQTMQSSYDSNEQYQQYNSYGTPTSDWGLQPQQPTQWNESKPESFENTSEQTENIQEKTETPASPDATSKTLTPEKEEPNPDNSPQEDLKDLPAEHYQAFMSAVLNQQKTRQKNSGTQRNLIEVQLIKYGSSSNDQDEAVKKASSGAGTSGGAVLQVNKRSRARRRKRERQKEKLKQLKQLKAQEKLVKGKESVVQSDLQPGLDSVPSVSEDEDEDLLRAQLLIDLSRKKNQKQVEPVVELPKSCLSDYQTVTADNIQAAHQDRFDSHSSGYTGHESTPPQSYPSSLESCPRLRPVTKTAVVKMHQQARFRENSPTHKVKVNLRHGLSDIGGISLDPKSSRYDYPIPKDNHSQKDMPKFKFPNIKPVIINLESDSDDENEEGEESCQDRATDEPQPSGSGEGDGVLSSSIDLLLKSMRNANKPEKNAKPSTQVKKGSALAKKTPVRKAPQSYSTPNVVRHLSRTQQVEYRRLKEQLRQKEMLQKKRQELLLRQKVLQKKMASAARISPESPQSGDNGGEMSDGGAARDLPSVNIPQVKSQTPSRTEEEFCDPADNGGNLQIQGETPPLPHSALQDTREVIIKETGGLQIQLANVNRDKDLGSNTVSADESCQGGSGTVKNVEMRKERDLSCVGSPAEDEDEEMLRLMVLKTLQKKVIDKEKSNDEENCESVDADSKSEKNDGSFISSDSEILKVVIHQRIDDVPTDEKETIEKAVEVAARSVVIENQTDLLENSKDVHQDGDVNGGEWMVLDEVLEEIDEGNGENANSEELAVVKEEHGNKVKKLLINEEDNGPTLECKETEGPESESVSKTSETECLVQEAKNNNECNNFSQLMESENTEVENQTPADHAQDLADRNLNEEIEDSRENEVKQSHNGERMDSGKSEMEVASGSAKETLGNSKDDERYKGKDTQQVPSKVSKKSTKSVDEPVDGVLPFTTQEHSSSENTEKRTEVVIADKSQDEDNNSLSAGKEELASSIGISCVSGEQDSESAERKANAEVSSGTEMKTLNSITSENNSNIQTIQKQVQIHGDVEGKKSLEHLSEKIEKNEQLEKDILSVSESTKTLKGSSVCSTSVNNTIGQQSAIRTQNSLPAALQKQKSNAVGNTSKSSSLSDVDVSRKPVRTKRLLLLKRVEHEYTQKRIAMNEVISQLASLVHEATEEERQRQSLKSTITKLREKLGQMETQLEDKASKLKAKMARIRNLQTQITKDREEISQLEHKGEILGKKELGSDYKLPKVLGSPHSKSKDHMRKKQLAHNIDALRQQIGQVYNRQMYSKTQARLEAKTKAVEKHISPLINVDKEEGTSVRRKVLQSGQAPVGQNLSPGNGVSLHVATSLSATHNVNVSVAWNKKLFDSTLNMQSAVSIKGAPSMIKNKGKRKIMPDNGNAITKAAKTENVCESKGTEMGAIIDNKAQEANENLPTRELDCKTETVHPASQQSAMGDTENVSFEDKQRQKLVSSTKEQNRSLDVTERIDEMNMLCPYDLLGRCNDDSCSYQHLRPPSHLTSKTTEIQGDPTGLSSHTSVSERQGALEECTVRITSSNETEPKDPLTNSGSAENIDGKVDPEQTIPQVDCKVDGLQVIVSNSQMPCSDKADSNLNLCQTNKEDFIFVKPTQLCGDSEEISEAFMSACDRSEKLNQEADSIIEQIALTPCIYSEQKNETSEKCETIVSLKEAVEESELLMVNNDKHRNLHSALPLHLKEGLPEVLEEFSKESPSEINTDIKSVPETDIKDELPKDLLEEKIQESDEKEDSGESAAQVLLSIGEKTSSAEQEDEMKVEVKEASTIALKKKKTLPKRSTPRKRTRNSDLTLELDVLSQSPEPTARRTRRSINQKDVSGALTATNRNSSKKDLTKERSAPVKASPRRGGRKTRGGKR
ncbi:uncharacterized protein LOC125038541 isoform X2 [Penaeus chinensis]|uniref:uncharacterized protein LOC125038541 isoform X2 n=1 Tax=Penaeus chinensis TaxID=139456 RepID=UPI001FB7CC63|nr:uncharacterized protein LOC125038541 isoform X2 [Penaeus chinensis]